MITIENRDDYITMKRLLIKSRVDRIRIKINGREYLWTRNEFTSIYNRSILYLHLIASRYINNCSFIARVKPSLKKEQLHDARKFVETTRQLVNLRKERGDA